MKITFKKYQKALQDPEISVDKLLKMVKKLHRKRLRPEAKALLLVLNRRESGHRDVEIAQLLMRFGEPRLAINRFENWEKEDLNTNHRLLTVAQAFCAVHDFAMARRVLWRLETYRLTQEDSRAVWNLAETIFLGLGYQQGWIEGKANRPSAYSNKKQEELGHEAQLREQEILILEQWDGSDGIHAQYFEFLQAYYPKVYKCLHQLGDDLHDFDFGINGKANAQGRLMLEHWGLEENGAYMIERGLLVDLRINDVPQYLGQIPPVWNYTVQKLHVWTPLNIHVKDNFDALFRLPLPQLDSLTIEYGQFDYRTMDLLLDNYPPKLQRLVIKQNYLQYDHARRWLPILMTRLTELDVVNAAFEPPIKGLPHLAEVVRDRMHDTSLRRLCLARCGLDHRDFAAMLQWKMPHLEEIILAGNEFQHLQAMPEVPAECWIYGVENLEIYQTGAEKVIVTWLLDNAPALKLKTILAEIDPRDEAFEGWVSRHPHLARFEVVNLWWEVETVLPVEAGG